MIKFRTRNCFNNDREVGCPVSMEYWFSSSRWGTKGAVATKSKLTRQYSCYCTAAYAKRKTLFLEKFHGYVCSNKKIALSRFLFYRETNFLRHFLLVVIARKLGMQLYVSPQVAWRQYLLLRYFNLRSLHALRILFRKEKKMLGSKEIKERRREIWRGETLKRKIFPLALLVKTYNTQNDRVKRKGIILLISMLRNLLRNEETGFIPNV